jgi:hypothetical protein
MGINVSMWCFIKQDGIISEYTIDNLFRKTFNTNALEVSRVVRNSGFVIIQHYDPNITIDKRSLFIFSNPFKLNMEEFDKEIMTDRLPLYFSLGCDNMAINIMHKIHDMFKNANYDVISYIKNDLTDERYKVLKLEKNK